MDKNVLKNCAKKYTAIFFTRLSSGRHTCTWSQPKPPTHTLDRNCQTKSISKTTKKAILRSKTNMKLIKQNTTPLFMRCEASWTLGKKTTCCQKLIPHNASSHPHWQKRVCRECKLRYENHVLTTIVSLMKQKHPKIKDYIQKTYNKLRKGRKIGVKEPCRINVCKA